MRSLSRGPDGGPVAKGMFGRDWVAEAGILRSPPFLAISLGACLGASVVIVVCTQVTQVNSLLANRLHACMQVQFCGTHCQDDFESCDDAQHGTTSSPHEIWANRKKADGNG